MLDFTSNSNKYIQISADFKKHILNFEVLKALRIDTLKKYIKISEEIVDKKEKNEFSSLEEGNLNDDLQKQQDIRNAIDNIFIGVGAKNSDEILEMDISKYCKLYSHSLIWRKPSISLSSFLDLECDEEEELPDISIELPSIDNAIKFFKTKWDIDIDPAHVNLFLNDCLPIIKILIAKFSISLTATVTIPGGQIAVQSVKLAGAAKGVIDNAYQTYKASIPTGMGNYYSPLYFTLSTSIYEESVNQLEDSSKEAAKEALGFVASFLPFGIGAIITAIKEGAELPFVIYCLYKSWQEVKEIREKLESLENGKATILLKDIEENPLLAAAYFKNIENILDINKQDSETTDEFYISCLKPIIKKAEKVLKDYAAVEFLNHLKTNPNINANRFITPFESQFTKSKKVSEKIVKKSPYYINALKKGDIITEQPANENAVKFSKLPDAVVANLKPKTGLNYDARRETISINNGNKLPAVHSINPQNTQTLTRFVQRGRGGSGDF